MKYFTYIIITVITLCGCEKIVDIKIPNEKTKYVIEANMFVSEHGNISVLIGKSAGLDEPEYDQLIDADIQLENLTQKSIYKLERVNNTNYFWHYGEIKTNNLDNFELNVKIGQENFVAQCKLKNYIPIDSIIISDYMQPGAKMITAYLTDPAGEMNFYKFNIHINGRSAGGIRITNDAFFQGKPFGVPMIGKIEKGDVIEVLMQHLDEPVYNYFYQLKSSQDNMNSSPANPKSNFSGDVLGYFNAYYDNTKSIVYQ